MNPHVYGAKVDLYSRLPPALSLYLASEISKDPIQESILCSTHSLSTL